MSSAGAGEMETGDRRIVGTSLSQLRLRGGSLLGNLLYSHSTILSFPQLTGSTMAKHYESRELTRQKSYYLGGSTSTAMLMWTPGKNIQFY